MDMLHKCLYAPSMSLGENIKYLREKRSLTYEAVGKAVGTDGQNIFNLEKRKSNVSKFAPKLAEFFDVDLSDLQSKDLSKGAHTPKQLHIAQPAANYQADRLTPEQTIEIISLMAQMDARERENMLDLARSAVRLSGRSAQVRDDKV